MEKLLRDSTTGVTSQELEKRGRGGLALYIPCHRPVCHLVANCRASALEGDDIPG